MWETQLEIKYEDYQLEDVNLDHLMNNTAAILQSLTPSKLKQIEGTDLQSANERRYCERWCRLTASQCPSACRIGRLVLDGDPNVDVRAFKFILSHIWGIDREPFQSYWMRYSLESEPKAILKYEEQSNTVVCKSGFWVNPSYPFLECSPDGIVGEDGLLEIKSSKIFKGQLQRFHKLISNVRIWPSEHGFEVSFEKSLLVFEISAFKVRNKRGIHSRFHSFS